MMLLVVVLMSIFLSGEVIDESLGWHLRLRDSFKRADKAGGKALPGIEGRKRKVQLEAAG